MKNFKRKVSALVLSTLFASMQVSYAAGLSDAAINKIEGGYAGQVAGNGSLDLNFNGNAHVNWDHLNVNKGESLNFNAVGGANGLTILNTVNKGMTTIAGQVSANSGIANLIISNPNGVLFDGAQFTTAGDTMITTQPMTATFVDGKMDITKIPTTSAVGVVTIQDSNINVGGEFNILAPSINVVEGTIKTGSGMKLITQNGQDYLSAGNLDSSKGVRLETVNVDGDVYVIADKGIVKTVGGGKINGNLNIKSDDSVALNYVANGKALHVTGDVDVDGYKGGMKFDYCMLISTGADVCYKGKKLIGSAQCRKQGYVLQHGSILFGYDKELLEKLFNEEVKGITCMNEISDITKEEFIHLLQQHLQHDMYAETYQKAE